MRKVTSVRQMQRLALNWRRRGVKVGFVPTMGYLHDGHLSLVKRARQLVGPHGIVVVSIYVNPTQFGPHEDLAKYPRDLARDTQLCREAGVDAIFCPKDAEMYPGSEDQRSSTFVEETQLSRGMEGASRPTHFRGVTTAVAKLFNMVQPDVAVFGAKDWQQAAVVRRMVRDLCFPVRIVVAPIQRESDGLAMSSRNKYLMGELRQQATVLFRSITVVRQLVKSMHKPVPVARLKHRVRQVIQTAPAARLDYVEFFESDTLEPVQRVGSGTHVALAVWIGRTRLIDNASL